ncbi:hypothetical protein MKX42_09845 [Paenibacillus sp. FSL R7-0204]|uniref:hypothetical protein n=1 Tax=Paenibacillus sp. FSL R7-0204 TaxID=2921675 RepID=UPI0030FAF8C6
MNMEFITIEEWDEAWWGRMEQIYHEAFPSGAKTKGILRSMLNRRIGYLHAGGIRGRLLRWLLRVWWDKLRTRS